MPFYEMFSCKKTIINNTSHIYLFLRSVNPSAFMLGIVAHLLVFIFYLSNCIS